MMEKLLLGIWFFSEWLVFPTCLPYQYHFVQQSLNWTEAQTHCRQTYADLATIESAEDTVKLLSILTSALYSSNVWIGLYSEVNWRWSDGFMGSGAEYRQWATKEREPSFYAGYEFCVRTDKDLGWWDYKCTIPCPVICYSGTPMYPRYVYYPVPDTWLNARSFCRQNYVDIATVTNDTKNQMVKSLVPPGYSPWIGLFRDPDIYWSDGSSFSFSNWYVGDIPVGSMETICGVTSTQTSGKWKVSSCDQALPFICYSLPIPAIKKVVKLRLKTDEPVDPTDPVLKQNIKQKLQDRLKENGVEGVTLVWRQQPDGEVFQKEKGTEN